MKTVIRKNVISLLLYVVVLVIYASLPESTRYGWEIAFMCAAWLSGHLKDLY